MFTLTPLTGYSIITEFQLTNLGSISSDFLVDWGDGFVESFNTSSEHIYAKKGIYDVIISDCETLSSFTLSAFNYFIEDAINVTFDSFSAYTGCQIPCTINISSCQPIVNINLYSRNSSSNPSQINDTFWNHLSPEWAFLNSDGESVSSIDIHCDPVIIDNITIGYTASDQIFYLDDMPGTPDLLFTITQFDQDTKINSNVYASISLPISATIPSKLSITTDGLVPFANFFWSDNDVPVVITVSNDIGCSNIMHYASGYLTEVNLVDGCYGIPASSYNNPLYTEGFDIPCINSDHFVTQVLNIPSSAIPSDIYSDLNIECGVNPDEVVRERRRRSPLQMVLTATGIFNVDGILYTLSGQSDPFDVYKFEEFHQFRRFGEEENIYNLLEKFSHFNLDELPQFKKYLQSIAGDGDTLGKMYDKIVNFSSDHSDIDLCQITSIYDIASKLDADIIDFGAVFPEDIKRFLHLSSIPLQKLVGIRYMSGKLGALLYPQDSIEMGEIVAYREVGGEFVDYFESPSNTTLQNLTSFPYYENLNNYCFYRWEDSQISVVDSVINYNDEKTLINRSVIDFDTWYKDKGIVDETFDYLLTKNLLNK